MCVGRDELKTLTMDEIDLSEAQPSYAGWLSQYTEKLSQLDPIELSIERSERRNDYQDSSQIYPDYLDYVDEWKWMSEEKMRELVSKYIEAAGKRNTKIACDCGKHHVLTTYRSADSGDVIRGMSTK
jgi:hypothetical protein